MAHIAAPPVPGQHPNPQPDPPPAPGDEEGSVLPPADEEDEDQRPGRTVRG